MKTSPLFLPVILLGAAFVSTAAAEDPAWGDNPAGFLGDRANFVNGVMFVGWSPQDHPNGGKGTPKYDIYNYLVLNHIDPNNKNWAPEAVEGLNKMHPCKYWAEDGESIDYEDEFVHSAPPGHGAPGGAIPGSTGEFIWGGRDGYVKPGNPCGGPSGQVNPPAGGGASGGGAGSSGGATGSHDGGVSATVDVAPSAGCPAGGKAVVATRPGGKDELDLSKVIVRNSPGDVAGWKATAQISLLDLQAKGPLINFTKKDGQGSWPDVKDASRWADGGSIEYTLWMIVKINGQWYGSGGIEYWRGLDRNGGAPSGFGHNWFYAADRWGPMANYQPKVGEKVGFMVTAGDARNNGLFKVKERSNVVVVSFPSDCGGTTVFSGVAP